MRSLEFQKGKDENISIPDLPLKENNMTDLNLEEILQLIKKRHGLSKQEILKNPEYRSSLLKTERDVFLAVIMKLEGFSDKEVCDFFQAQYDVEDMDNLHKRISAFISACLSDKVKIRIRDIFNDPSFSFNRDCIRNNCLDLLQAILKKTNLSVDRFFKKSQSKVRTHGKFRIDSILAAYNYLLVSDSLQDKYSRSEVKLIYSTFSKYLTEEAMFKIRKRRSGGFA